MKEIWVRAKGYPNLEVSNLGNVVDVETGRPPAYFMKDGRIQLNLKGGRWNNIVQLHRLIAASFFEDDINGYEINHADGDRTNNAVWNLEFATTEQNREHAYEHELMSRPVQIANLDTNETYSSLQEAGRKLGYLSALVIPKNARDGGVEFQKRGYRLKIL
jgi:hypothetical protein